MTTFPYPFNIMFPGAGGNFQAFDFWSPRVSVNFAGNPAVEREVNEDVASYGTPDRLAQRYRRRAGQDRAGCGEGRSGGGRRADNAQGRHAKDRRRSSSGARQARSTARAMRWPVSAPTDQDGYRRFVRSLDPDQPPSAA